MSGCWPQRRPEVIAAHVARFRFGDLVAAGLRELCCSERESFFELELGFIEGVAVQQRDPASADDAGTRRPE
jgi:hypothetical protein